MDRQSLLEQKRQRLQELRQRRIVNKDKDNKSVDQLIDKLQSVPNNEIKQLNVAIQVDTLAVSKAEHTIPKASEKEYISYDKAIQATDETIDEESKSEEVAEQKQPSKKNDYKIAKYIDENELNRSVKDSIKLLNKIVIDDSIDISNIIDYAKGSEDDTLNKARDIEIPFKQIHNITGINGRAVVSIDISPHFMELIVVSYSESSSKSTDSPGLAIIYNIKNSTVFPEFFLNCTAPITQIKFDKMNANKIIGGLADGKLVIWDMQNTQPTSVAILPSLSTPPLKSYHTLAISSIHQSTIENNDSVISTSFDGTINVWSTSILASPKFESIKLYVPNELKEFSNFKEPLSISKVTILSTEKLIRSDESHSQQNFLSQMVVGAESGKIFKLMNDSGYIASIHEDDNNEIHSSAITSIYELTDKLIITSSLDWNIKIWSVTNKYPLIKISTKYLILDIAIRPNHPLQFVAIGFTDKAIIQFWDLNYKLMNPALEIPIEVDFPTTAKFNDSGDKLIIGFNNGSVLIWSIDESSLIESIKSEVNIEIDEGLINYLKANDVKY